MAADHQAELTEPLHGEKSQQKGTRSGMDGVDLQAPAQGEKEPKGPGFHLPASP